MNNLPKEIIAKILQHLPQKDLLKASLVSKLFNEIITSYKFTSTIYINNKIHEIPPTRKYSRAVIKNDDGSNYHKAFEATGDSIKEVHFDQHTTTLNSVTTILNLLPNVKRISFNYVNLDDDDEVFEGQVNPLNDVTLLFYETNPNIFKVLNQISIKSIDLRYYGDTPYYDFSSIVPFMRDQKELKSFSMSGFYESNMMYGTIPRGDFKLKEFKIAGCDLEEWNYLETFLADHLESLEKFTVERVSNWDCSDIIKSCGNLKVLELEETLLDNLEDTIPSLRELSVQLPMQKILNFPNVEKLHVENGTTDINRSLSNIMKKVTNLSLRYGNCEGILMENVTTMSFMNISDITADFFVQHNKITDLTLRNIFNLDDNLLSAIAENLGPHLKIIRILGLNNLTGNALTIIKDHCKKLQVLDTATWSQQFKNQEWRILSEMHGLKIYYETFNF